MPFDIDTEPLPPRPPLGTVINDRFVLVEMLGEGAHACVYRAVDRLTKRRKSYAVKCLLHPLSHRYLSSREVALHKLASAHPNVVKLHFVIETSIYTFLVMDYSRDGDLFSRILETRLQLGETAPMKRIFLQLLDAVEYCHSLGIYHRDLKPENIMCFNGGRRIAVTDFGLATTERLSGEFHTGSMYHMSPECFSSRFLCAGSYSPCANDIWSLGIILINLVTGRTPWTSTAADDPTFRGYLKNPATFLPTALPISAELNVILTRMLNLDWRQRMTLQDLKIAIEGLNNFYCDGVVFRGSVALFPWQANRKVKGSRGKPTENHVLKSQWSNDSVMDNWCSSSRCATSSPCPSFTTYDTTRMPSSTRSPTSPMSFESIPSTPPAVARDVVRIFPATRSSCDQSVSSNDTFAPSSMYATMPSFDPYTSLVYDCPGPSFRPQATSVGLTECPIPFTTHQPVSALDLRMTLRDLPLGQSHDRNIGLERTVPPHYGLISDIFSVMASAHATTVTSSSSSPP